MCGNDSVLDDFLLVIDVVEKQVQRKDALGEAPFEIFPFLGGNDARDEVERENAFGAAGIAVDVEGDTLAQEGEIDRMAFGVKILAREVAESGMEFLVMAERPAAIATEHFVEEADGVVTVQQRAGRWRFCQ